MPVTNEERHAIIIVHIVLVTKNVHPSKIKGKGPYVFPTSTNCGNNAKKNNATLGFKTFVKIPCL